MDDIAKMNMKIVPITWVIGIITLMLFYFFMPNDIKMLWIKGFALGVATGLLCFNILTRDTRKYSKKVQNGDSKSDVIKWTLFSYLKRFVLSGAVMGCMIFYPDMFSIIAGLIGYMLIKVVMFFVVMLSKDKDGM